MSTRDGNIRYLVDQLVKYDVAANDYYLRLETLFREISNRYGSSEVAEAFEDKALGKAASPGDVSVDNDLRGDLPAGVGENKSFRWYAKNKGGESFTDVAQDTYDNADTIQETIQLVTDYIKQEVTSTDQ